MENFIKGVDLSTLIELEKCGARYFDQGKEEDGRGYRYAEAFY